MVLALITFKQVFYSFPMESAVEFVSYLVLQSHEQKRKNQPVRKQGL